MVALAPFWVSALATMTAGRGSCCSSRGSAVMPSITGISRSSSTTCGRPAGGIAAKAATACRPSPTRETTLMPGSDSSTRVRAERTVALSSQSMTRTGSACAGGAGGGGTRRAIVTQPHPAAGRPG